MAVAKQAADPTQKVLQAVKRRQKSSKTKWLSVQYWLWGSLAVALVAIAVGIALHSPTKVPNQVPVNNDALIRSINNKQSFVAAHIPAFEQWTTADVKRTFGNVFWSQVVQYVPVCQLVSKSAKAPRTRYDPREKWEACFTEPYLSGNCSSSWATAVASSLSNRLCMRNPGKLPGVRLSPQDLLSCDTVNKGCKGGTVDGAFAYIQKHGIVTEGCFPFRAENAPKVKCNQKCISEEPFTMSSFCKMVDEEGAQREIVGRGPIVAVMGLRDDFLVYSGGVYRPSKDSTILFDGKKHPVTHIVKIIGWGVENSVPYWIIENNFGKGWGENGFARIARETLFEGYMFAGEMAALEDASDEIDLDAEATNIDIDQ